MPVHDAAPSGRPGGTIRGRIARILALPMAAVLVLLGIIAVGEVDRYRTAARTAQAVTLELAVLELVQDLQTERGLAAGLLGGIAGFRAEFAPARQRVDKQRAEVESLTEPGGRAEDRVAGVLTQLDGLAGVRAATDTGAGAQAATAGFYTGLITQLINVDYGLSTVGDTELRRGYATLSMFSVATESAAQERMLLNGVFTAGAFGPGEFVQFVSTRSARDTALLAFNQYGNPAALDAKNQVLNTDAGRQVAAMEQAALTATDGRALRVDATSWWSASGAVLDALQTAGRGIGVSAQDRAEDLQRRAGLRLGGLAVVTLLLLAGAGYLAFVAARALARPLDALAAEAHRIAADELPRAVHRAGSGTVDDPPSPVRVDRGATTEVRQVADAFERVQTTAYALATEQARLRRATAESLADLGRRNQNLLRRQLGFITKLEREEANPAGLANLFELDHLATRMRRNAESLLVLVGAASPRQWSEPLPITDVIRAAISEVEEYRRVTLRRVDDALVAGSAVTGVAHMLAELIENGLAFSPPDVDVEIHGRVIGDGYLIAVTDQGIGMRPDEMADANQRLRGEGDFITAPARFLGHFVVGRLAAETGIGVQLAPSPVTGVTARLSLPASVLVERKTVTAAAAPARRLPPAPRENVPLRSNTIEYVVVDPAPAPPAESVAADRTPNGLRRRTPRNRREPSTATAVAVAEPPPAVEDTPEALRTRLTAFRDGVLRAGTARSQEENV
ncbi:sensor histidine kinase [Paractinoplanes toevensis]|uniref:histidine kinase n=1 Tax=Paractinoplanes toevensis TaxID=571911 RepID=A0A919T5L1_9ACTN|nr:ATP-binding protein [Actinoplanes toevensis]GIM88300.1 ATPase [Actinoplanes toevensis]